MAGQVFDRLAHNGLAQALIKSIPTAEHTESTHLDKRSGRDARKVLVIEQVRGHLAHGGLAHAHGRLQARIPQRAPHETLHTPGWGLTAPKPLQRLLTWEEEGRYK